MQFQSREFSYFLNSEKVSLEDYFSARAAEEEDDQLYAVFRYFEFEQRFLQHYSTGISFFLFPVEKHFFNFTSLQTTRF